MVHRLRKYQTLKKFNWNHRKILLKKYRDRLGNTESANSLVALAKTGKYGKGVPDANKAVHEISYYSSVDDLCHRLSVLCAAKQAEITV